MKTSMAGRLAALSSAQRIELLRRLVTAGRLAEIPDVVPARDGGSDGPARLSPAQEDLWAYQSLYPASGALNLCCAYHFEGPVDPADLETALAAVQAGHDILRTRITGEADAPRVELCRDPLTLRRMDLRETSTPLREVLTAFSRAPFAPGGRLIQGLFIRVDDNHATLALRLHHVITDWWSFDILHADFAVAYRAVREGTAPRPRRPRIQYADFASWQRELEEAGVFGAQLAFWRDYLADPPPPLAVGGGGAAGGPGITHIPIEIDGQTEAAVRAFARQHGMTVYAVLMTAFAVLAHRLSGQPDVIIGTPIANRSAQGLDQLIGYVMNAVPTRWRIGQQDTFTGLARRFAAEFPRILASSDVPAARIVTMLGPERVPGRSPLFQWVFMYLPGQESIGALREFSAPERIQTGGEHDVVGVVQEDGHGMAGGLEVRTDIYPAETVRHWAASFSVLLTGLLAGPECPVGQVGLLSPSARQAILGMASGEEAARPPVSLAGLVRSWAARTPAATAVETGRRSLTYAELDARAGRLAARLARRGAGPGTVVALALPKSADLIVALLAVQHAGAAYLPVDVGYPAERVRYLLADAAPVLIVTDQRTAGGLPDAATPRLLLAQEPGARGGPVPADGRWREPDPRLAGYVTYTSGTSGRPKGVAVTHQGIASLAATLVRRLGLGPASRILQLGSPSFDISVGELCMAFGAGGTLVIPPAGPLAGESLAAVLTASRITAMLVPPAVLASVPPGQYPDLRVLCLGGEACPEDLIASWSAGGRGVFNAYGPTEATVAATLSDPLGDPLAPGAGSPPIGRPVAGGLAYVLDERLRLVPVGVPGELYLAGDGLARGYLGLPGTTAERFVADPYAASPGARMYRTGDVARWRADGQLDFLGRDDNQISLHGLRIEPAEVEAVLARHHSVAQAVAALREDVPGEQRLVGYLVPRPGIAPDHDGLRRHALAALPPHMVPSMFVTLDVLPVTAHGKLDRAALPAPVPVARVARPAAGGREELLCELFTQVLFTQVQGTQVQGAQAGPLDDFFELAGDSIMAIQLVSRARAAGLVFTPYEVFVSRTPASLAAIARDVAVAAATEADDGAGRFPLTPIMRWWREQGGTAAAFTMSALFPVPAGTSRSRVAAALATLGATHATLRMRLLGDASAGWELEALPAEHARPEPALSVVAASGLTEAELTRAAQEVAARTRLDPGTGQPLAATWFDAGAGRDGRLLLTLHHLACDGVSLRILAEELAQLLGGAAEPPPEGTSFRRWARRLAAQAVRPDWVAAELPRWERMLSGSRTALAPGKPLAGGRGTLTAVLPVSLTGKLLAEVTAAFRCGPQEVFLTALLAAAIRWRGSGTELLVDVEGHGRQPLSDDIDVSRTVGWFTVQYPVRLDAGTSAGSEFWLAGASTGRALKQVKERLRDIAAGGLGYGLLRYLNPQAAARLSGLQVPDVRFNYLGRFASLEDGGARLVAADQNAPPLGHAVELDVVTELTADGPRLSASWSYATGTITAAQARRLSAYWQQALGVLARHAGQDRTGGASSSDFPLVELTQEEIDAMEADLDDLTGSEWR
jgi:amino acid adenylation domain-containing protein/non-ribosomal peptide synthase protein (TIGR01720 family)